MSHEPAIKSLEIQNLLSFGEDGAEIELGPLNVLIGPNGSGKSNLIEVVGLLKNIPKDFSQAIAESGGISEWLWKGTAGTPVARIEIVAKPRRTMSPLRYKLCFTRKGSKLAITDESLESESFPKGKKGPDIFLKYSNGTPVLYSDGTRRTLLDDEIDPQQPVLSQRKDPSQYPEITYLGRLFAKFRLYPNWEFGHVSKIRDLYSAELKNDFLEEDVSNLGLMLNKFRSDPQTKPELVQYLRMFYEQAQDIETPIQGGLVDIRVEEKNKASIPASRLSDGTLRWLALLTILLHPSPPPLVCLEEPELGLHPDVLRLLAELLIRASSRMQLIVTTHSDASMEQLSETPDSVIVCEREGGSTNLRRLSRQGLSSWLKRYTLGQLWRTGEIGGNRW